MTDSSCGRVECAEERRAAPHSPSPRQECRAGCFSAVFRLRLAGRPLATVACRTVLLDPYFRKQSLELLLERDALWVGAVSAPSLGPDWRSGRGQEAGCAGIPDRQPCCPDLQPNTSCLVPEFGARSVVQSAVHESGYKTHLPSVVLESGRHVNNSLMHLL